MSGERYYIYRGKSITIQDMVGMSGVCAGTIRSRLRNGWTVEAAMQPRMYEYRRDVTYEWRGRQCSLREISEETGVPVDRIRRRRERYPQISMEDIVEMARESLYATRYMLDGSPVRLVDVCRKYGIRYNATRKFMAAHPEMMLEDVLKDPAIIAKLQRIEPSEEGKYMWKSRYRTVEEIAEMEGLDPEKLWAHMDEKNIGTAVSRTLDDSGCRAYLAGFELRDTAHTICMGILYGTPESNGFREDEDGGYTFGEGIARYRVTRESALAHLTMEYRRTGKKGGLSRWFGKFKGALREVSADGTC